jgi:hypothetical protein
LWYSHFLGNSDCISYLPLWDSSCYDDGYKLGLKNSSGTDTSEVQGTLVIILVDFVIFHGQKQRI